MRSWISELNRPIRRAHPSGSHGRSPAVAIFRDSLTQGQMIEGSAVRLVPWGQT